jgi:spermidine/putrescine transport system permease protein
MRRPFALSSHGWQMLPALLWLTGFCFVPLILVLIYSFGERSAGGGVDLALSLANYRRLLESSLYLNVTLRSLRIAAIATVATLLVSYPVAYFIALVATRWKGSLLVLLVIPWWCSILVKNFAWVALLAETGVANRLLLGMGAVERPLKLIYTETAVVIGLVHVLIPFMVLPIYATLEKLDRRLIEAAENLGCSPIRAFFEVSLPLSLPGMAAGATLTFILAFGSFVTPALLGSERTVMVANVIQDQFLQAFDWPFGSTLAMAVLSLVLAILIIFNRLAGIDRLLGPQR